MTTTAAAVNSMQAKVVPADAKSVRIETGELKTASPQRPSLDTAESDDALRALEQAEAAVAASKRAVAAAMARASGAATAGAPSTVADLRKQRRSRDTSLISGGDDLIPGAMMQRGGSSDADF